MLLGSESVIMLCCFNVRANKVQCMYNTREDGYREVGDNTRARQIVAVLEDDDLVGVHVDGQRLVIAVCHSVVCQSDTL